MFRYRHCLAHVSRRPGRRGGALDCAGVETHMSTRRWTFIFIFSRMKNNRAWRCVQTRAVVESIDSLRNRDFCFALHGFIGAYTMGKNGAMSAYSLLMVQLMSNKLTSLYCHLILNKNS